MRLFNQAQTYRNVFAAQWEEAAVLGLPTSRNTFYYGSYNFPGEKKQYQQIDSTVALALMQFAAIAESLVTPKNSKWHGLKGDPYVMKDRDTRKYFDDVTDILFDYRYRPIGNFHGQNASNWQSLGCFGNATMYIDKFDNRWHRGAVGLRYKAVPLGETYFLENHQGIVDTMIRWFRLTARQAVQKFGEEWLPGTLQPALAMDSQTPFNFLHCVRPRDEETYDPDRLDERGKPFESYYVCIEGQCLMAEEGGYRTFPFAVDRYDQTPGEVYGRGPMQIVLAGAKTLNAMKTTHLTAGHRAVNPVYLLADDGAMSMDQRPGALNRGGVTADGKPLVHTLPVGDIRISEEMMAEERRIVDTVFLTSLFKTLTEHPEMTATQVIELLNERGMLVAPALGRAHNEYVGPMVERELDLLSDMTDGRGRPILPPMPPRLKEAAGAYEITDTSPLAMAAKMNMASGYVRALQITQQLVSITGDHSALDVYDLDTATPEIAAIQGAPERWMSDAKAIEQKRKERAKQMQTAQQIQAMPAQAAMLKAQAAVRQAGGAPAGPAGQSGGI